MSTPFLKSLTFKELVDRVGQLENKWRKVYARELSGRVLSEQDYTIKFVMAELMDEIRQRILQSTSSES